MRATSFLLAGLVCLAGCDQNKHENVTIRDKDKNVTISGDGQHFSIHSSDGKQTVDINTNGGAAVGNLPSFVSVYPGAKVMTSATGTSATGTGGTLVLEIKASPAEVLGFYKQKATSAGFKEEASMNMGGTQMFTAKSGDRTIQIVTSSGDGGATHAQVTWSGK